MVGADSDDSDLYFQADNGCHYGEAKVKEIHGPRMFDPGSFLFNFSLSGRFCDGLEEVIVVEWAATFQVTAQHVQDQRC